MNRRHMKYTLSFLLFLLAAATVTVPAADSMPMHESAHC